MIVKDGKDTTEYKVVIGGIGSILVIAVTALGALGIISSQDAEVATTAILGIVGVLVATPSISIAVITAAYGLVRRDTKVAAYKASGSGAAE